jgi:hypothetical protein
LKPGGSFTRLRFSLIALAFGPLCGTVGMFRSVVATLNCLSFSMFACASAGSAAAASAAAATKRSTGTWDRGISVSSCGRSMWDCAASRAQRRFVCKLQTIPGSP